MAPQPQNRIPRILKGVTSAFEPIFSAVSEHIPSSPGLTVPDDAWNFEPNFLNETYPKQYVCGSCTSGTTKVADIPIRIFIEAIVNSSGNINLDLDRAVGKVKGLINDPSQSQYFKSTDLVNTGDDLARIKRIPFNPFRNTALSIRSKYVTEIANYINSYNNVINPKPVQSAVAGNTVIGNTAQGIQTATQPATPPTPPVVPVQNTVPPTSPAKAQPVVEEDIPEMPDVEPNQTTVQAEPDNDIPEIQEPVVEEVAVIEEEPEVQQVKEEPTKKVVRVNPDGSTDSKIVAINIDGAEREVDVKGLEFLSVRKTQEAVGEDRELAIRYKALESTLPEPEPGQSARKGVNWRRSIDAWLDSVIY